jgi:hypothetical protein
MVVASFLHKSLILTALVAFSCGTLFGGPIADVSSWNWAPHGVTQTVGWTFTVNQAITVTDLYWFDPVSEDASHVLGPYPVNIWITSGATPLLGTAGICVGNTCSGSTWSNDYWDTPISSLLLSPGGYTIGGLIGPGDPIADTATVVTDPRISYFSNVAVINPVLTMPTGENGGQEKGYFGPNFGIAAETGIPEPGTFALLLLGLGALGLRRARR